MIQIRTIRNELVTIPNQSLLQKQIVNYSGFHYLATAVEVSVGYERDKNEVKCLLVEAASNTHGIVTDNPKPYVILKRFDNFAAVYELRAYTDRPNVVFSLADISFKGIFFQWTMMIIVIYHLPLILEVEL